VNNPNSSFHPDTTSSAYLPDANDNQNQTQNTSGNNMMYHNDIQAMMDERKYNLYLLMYFNA
jgi:hypothetical protein